MKNFQHAMRPGAFLVDRIPLLKYVPGYGRQLKQYHKFEMQLYCDQMDRVRLEMVRLNSLSETELWLKSGMMRPLQESNKGGDSFMRMLLERTDEHRLSRGEMAYLAGNLFGAGAETVCPLQLTTCGLN